MCVLLILGIIPLQKHLLGGIFKLFLNFFAITLQIKFEKIHLLTVTFPDLFYAFMQTVGPSKLHGLRVY